MRKTQHTREYRRLTAALRRARQAAGLTQAEAAARLGAYANYVSKCESGERRVDVIELADFCRAYRCDLIDLLAEAGIASTGPARDR
jgi:transcriptional regulator with XRE-family HTH domain